MAAKITNNYIFDKLRLTKDIKPKAFTLAEMLITLTIIGILAAMTIPSLIAQQEKIGYVSTLKKFYTEFNEALQLYMQQNGTPGNLQATGIFNTNSGSTNTNSLFSYNEIKPFLNIVRSCGTGYGGGTGLYYAGNKNLQGPQGQGLYDPIGITANGVALSLYVPDNTCTSQMFPDNSSEKFCAYLLIDINGIKTPNIVGRDVFWFSITSKGNLFPLGGKRAGGCSWDNVSACGGQFACVSATDNKSLGWGCAGRIMDDNWQMLY